MTSSREPLGQFQLNFVGNMPRGWGFTQIKGLALLGAQSGGKIRKTFDKYSKVFFS